MRYLVVEDDPNFLPVIELALTRSRVASIPTVARSASSGLTAIANEDCDLAICDLRLPSTDGNLDMDVAHGVSLVNAIRVQSPGTKTVVFSAFGREIIEREIMPLALHDDPFGSGPEPMVDYVDKGDIQRWVDAVEHAEDQLNVTDGLPITCADHLLRHEERLLRLYARRAGASEVTAVGLSGLSSSRTLSVEAFLGRDLVARGVLKVDRLDHVRDERTRYQEGVARLLPADAYASLIDTLSAGAGRFGATAYAVADGYVQLFELLPGQSIAAAEVVTKLRVRLTPWTASGGSRQVTLGEIRQRFVTEDQLDSVRSSIPGGLDVASLETTPITVHECFVHGDMHAGNILVAPSGAPMLIDYGRTGSGVASLDAVQLELSLQFHPLGREALPDLPDLATFDWCARSASVAASQVPEFVDACREWAESVQASPEEPLAVAYALAIRQLRFEVESHDAALAVLDSVATRLS